MFESSVGLPPVGAAQLAGLIEQNHAELMARECRMLQLACAWADCHYLDSGSQDYQPLIQRACAWGGEGTRKSRSIALRNSAQCRAPVLRRPGL